MATVRMTARPDKIELQPARTVQARQQRAERQIGDRRQGGVPAREARGKDARKRCHELWSRAASRDPERGAPSFGHQQISHDGAEHETKHGVAAQAGDVARRLFQPSRTERIGRIRRVPQGEHDGLVELRGVAFDDLLGDVAKGEQEQGGEKNAAQQPNLRPPAPRPNRQAPHQRNEARARLNRHSRLKEAERLRAIAHQHVLGLLC